MDDATRREIDKVCWKTLKDAGVVRPPVRIEKVLDFLKLNREFYDLQDPSFLDRAKHKIEVQGQKLINVLSKIKLIAVLFYDEDRIIVSSGLSNIQRDFPSFHESTHQVLEWHRPFFHGDTAQTLDPDYHEALEAEANYGAGAFMFCGPVFTTEVLDTTPDWDSVAGLKERYDKSFATTLRRYVEHSHDRPMAMLVSTAPWLEKPAEQPERWRHFVPSGKMASQFSAITASDLLGAVDANIARHGGGLIADFTYCLDDDNGVSHEFRAESFFNQYYVLTLFVELRRMATSRIVVAGGSTEAEL